MGECILNVCFVLIFLLTCLNSEILRVSPALILWVRSWKVSEPQVLSCPLPTNPSTFELMFSLEVIFQQHGLNSRGVAEFTETLFGHLWVVFKNTSLITFVGADLFFRASYLQTETPRKRFETFPPQMLLTSEHLQPREEAVTRGVTLVSFKSTVCD